MSFNLITTKLIAPPPPQSVVERRQLFEQLGQGSKLVLVSAPAGAGKSTLLSSWLEESGQGAAWLSLDANDNDLAHFLLYLVAALQQVEPELGLDLSKILRSQLSIQPEAIIIRLINELAGFKQNFILVLDDYHVISNPKIHDAIEFLLDHLPGHLTLIIATRIDPPLALSRLRVRGQLFEIRADALRFSVSEIAELLNNKLHLELSDGALSSLEERTEGWVAGLQLAALSLSRHKDKEAFVSAFAGSHRHLVDYLVDEVLAKQSQELRLFLQRTSVLERFTLPLCEAVTEQSFSPQWLHQVEAANLFLIPLDHERKWYRYHHLFAEFLRHRLGEAEAQVIPELHRRASDWFEREGWSDEAIHHALLGGDLARAGHLVESIAFSLQNTSNNVQLVKYVSRFPLELLSTLPKLGIYYGWALINTGQVALLNSALPVIERSAAHAQQPLAVRACVLQLQAYQCLWQMDFAGVVKLCQEALAILAQDGAEPTSNEERWLRTSAPNLIAYSYYFSDLTQADAVYPATRELSQKLGNFIGAANDFARHGWVKHLLGQSQQAFELFREGLRTLETWKAERGRVLNVGELYLNLAKLLYEWNRLDEAQAHLQKASDLNQHSQFPPVLALEYETSFQLELARGRTETAVAVLGKLDALLAGAHPSNRLHAQVFGAMAMNLRLLLAAPDSHYWHDEVTLWLRAWNIKPNNTFGYPHEGGYFVLAKMLVTQATPAEALPLLERLAKAAATQDRTHDLIRYRLLQTLAHQSLGQGAKALEILQGVLILAEPQGYCRSFVDAGLVMKVLLETVAKRNPTPYLAKLLEAFPKTESETLEAAQVKTLSAGATVVGDKDWHEPLNERELTVLRLLSAGQTNKGIAKELRLSPNTVKWYIQGLYDKLGVNGRLQAVTRAKELGLF